MSKKIITFPDIYKGDTKTFLMSFYDVNKKPLDLSNRTIYMTIKRDKNDSDTDAVIQKIWHVAPNTILGQFVIELTSSETILFEAGVYPIDLRLSLAGNPKTIIVTLEGIVTIEQPVTLDILK